MKNGALTLNQVNAVITAMQHSIRQHEKELVIMKWKLLAFKHLKKKMELKEDGRED